MKGQPNYGHGPESSASFVTHAPSRVAQQVQALEVSSFRSTSTPLFPPGPEFPGIYGAKGYAPNAVIGNPIVNTEILDDDELMTEFNLHESITPAKQFHTPTQHFDVASSSLASSLPTSSSRKERTGGVSTPTTHYAARCVGPGPYLTTHTS